MMESDRLRATGSEAEESESESASRKSSTYQKTHTYTPLKTSPFVSPSACSTLVKLPNVIVLVGLPARGKTYISRKLCRYLNWIGIRTKVFNCGDYRRSACNNQYHGESFFNPKNDDGEKLRDECAHRALVDMCGFLERGEGDVGIFDATNTTRARREMVLRVCSVQKYFRVFFVESVCDDPKIIEANITDVKVNSPDYKGMGVDAAKEDFLQRIKHYEAQYEPIDDKLDNHLSYIRLMNAGRSFYVNDIEGHIQSRVVYFLMNIHLTRRCIYLSRHGESEYNQLGRLGGDSPLSPNGLKYAEELKKYFAAEKVVDLRVWSSQKIRAVQTSSKLKGQASYIEHWKALDEIDAGTCEGLTYAEVADRYPQQLENRDNDKYHYRYPSGESYEDLVARLEPVIMELERQSNVLVVSHQAVIRCILSYFLNKDSSELPYQKVPLHTVIKLTPIAYGCQFEKATFGIDAADTHRDKRTIPETDETEDVENGDAKATDATPTADS